jgi:hypothetical protein
MPLFGQDLLLAELSSERSRYDKQDMGSALCTRTYTARLLSSFLQEPRDQRIRFRGNQRHHIETGQRNLFKTAHHASKC